MPSSFVCFTAALCCLYCNVPYRNFFQMGHFLFFFVFVLSVTIASYNDTNPARSIFKIQRVDHLSREATHVTR